MECKVITYCEEMLIATRAGVKIKECIHLRPDIAPRELAQVGPPAQGENARIDVEALLRRLEALEQGQEVSVDQQKKSIVQYALRQAPEFDKYEAINMVERLQLLAREKRDDTTAFYTTVHASLWQRIGCSPEQFRSYVLALLGDRDGTMKRSWRQSARSTRPLGLEIVNVGGGGHNQPRSSSLALPRHQPGPSPIRRQAANR
eukprot:gene11377-12563_t